jgi:hypothetical protein
VKPTAPTTGNRYAFRCTTAGTASTEPSWNASAGANNQTITTGGVTFTNVSGQSAYGWSAAAGDLLTIYGTSYNIRTAAGDRVFISSDHTETPAAGQTYGPAGISYTNVIQIISVNRAGSVPPVAADVLPGATLSMAAGQTTTFDSGGQTVYMQGLTISAGLHIAFQPSFLRGYYLKNCALILNSATPSATIRILTGRVTLDNTTVQFGNAGQVIMGYQTWANLIWINTPSAILGTVPTTLLQYGTGGFPWQATIRGVDLSAVTGNLVGGSSSSMKMLFDSCRIASGVTRLLMAGNSHDDEVELINCYDGTRFLSERYQQPSGAVTTEFTITLQGGAQDNVGVYSHKMVSAAANDKWTNQLLGFWLDVNLTTTGAPRTASVEIVGSASLNNDDISLAVEYFGTSGSTLASIVTTLPPSSLTTPSAITTSTATWNSLPATPVRQTLSVTFTPQTAGRVRAQVRLGKPSTTVYYNPQIIIT